MHWRLFLKLLLHLYVGRYTLVGVFIGVEAEGEGTVGFFDLSISGCLLDP